MDNLSVCVRASFSFRFFSESITTDADTGLQGTLIKLRRSNIPPLRVVRLGHQGSAACSLVVLFRSSREGGTTDPSEGNRYPDCSYRYLDCWYRTTLPDLSPLSRDSQILEHMREPIRVPLWTGLLAWLGSPVMLTPWPLDQKPRAELEHRTAPEHPHLIALKTFQRTDEHRDAEIVHVPSRATASH